MSEPQLNAVRRLNFKVRGFHFEVSGNTVGIWNNEGPRMFNNMTPQEAKRLRDWLNLVLPKRWTDARSEDCACIDGHEPNCPKAPV